MQEQTKVLKSGVWYMVSNIVVKGTVFLTTPIFSRILTKEEYGYFSNFTACMSILLILVTLNLGVTLISAKYDYEKNLDSYYSSTLILSTVSILLWTGVFTVLSKPISALIGIEVKYIYLMLLYAIFYAAIDLFQVKQRYAYCYKMNVTFSLVNAFGTAILSLLLVYFLKDKVLARIIGYIVPTIVLGIIAYISFIRKSTKLDFSTWKYGLRICIPFIPHILSLYMLNSSDQVMIRQIRGAEETALYSVAYTCGVIISMFTSAFNGAYSPWLGDKLHEKAYGDIRKASTVCIICFGVVTLGLMYVSPLILLILGGPGYASAKYVMPPVTLGCACQFVYTMFASTEQFTKKIKGMAFASVTAAILNIILNSIFIPHFGYIAAAYTTLVSYLWLLVVHMYLVYRLGLHHAFNYRFILGYVIVLFAMIFVIYATYASTVVCVLFGVVYGLGILCAVVKFRSNIKQLLLLLLAKTGKK